MGGCPRLTGPFVNARNDKSNSASQSIQLEMLESQETFRNDLLFFI